jgi:ribose transport system permease protein
MKIKRPESFPLNRSTAVKFLDKFSTPLVTVLIIVIATIAKGTDFLSVQNFMNILRNNSVIGIIALGMTFVIISGGIDLSVGSVLVAAGAVIIVTLNMTGEHSAEHPGRPGFRCLGSG